jgi:hypothetical protein
VSGFLGGSGADDAEGASCAFALPFLLLAGLFSSGVCFTVASLFLLFLPFSVSKDFESVDVAFLLEEAPLRGGCAFLGIFGDEVAPRWKDAEEVGVRIFVPLICGFVGWLQVIRGFSRNFVQGWYKVTFSASDVAACNVIITSKFNSPVLVLTNIHYQFDCDIKGIDFHVFFLFFSFSLYFLSLFPIFFS